MKTFQVKLVTEDNSMNSFFWAHKKCIESMYSLIERAIRYSDEKSEKDDKKWIVVDIKRIN